MRFATVRSFLFQVHMWIGLVLGILLALLGLSGSLLVYDEQVANLIDKRPQAIVAGMPLPLSMLQGIARDTAAQRGIQGGQMQMILPEQPRQTLSVRFNGLSVMGNVPGAPRRQGLVLFMDPVSGQVLGSRTVAMPGLLTFAHQLHGNFLMSRAVGRPFVGWLGLAMCILGLTGLVLWWPKKGQWKNAFKVRKSATGLRFHRELHAAAGIWTFLIFIIVSFSGLVISWPQLFGLSGGPTPPTVTVMETKRLGATEAVIAAQKAVPGLEPRSVTIPADADQPITVSYLSNGAMGASVLVDPYRGTVLAVRDSSASFLAWMRPVHAGALNSVWKFLVFLSGLVPLLFVVTGIVMWLKKRARRIPMTTMTDEVTARDAAEEEAAVKRGFRG